MSHTFILAEPGGTHGGSLAEMHDMIDLAARAGANAYKGQWVSSPEELVARRRAHGYAGAYQNIAFPVAWHADLRSHCDGVGIEYVCAVYLPADIAVVDPHVSRHKISSFESTDDVFLHAHVPFSKPMIVSCGMSSADEICRLKQFRYEVPEVSLLHCISSYSAPLDQLNLARIRADDLDGFSDHSGMPWVGAWAVAAGARIVEVHFRSEICPVGNPDYPHSLRPDELALYVRMIRQVEAAMGTGESKPMECERPMMAYRVTARA